MLNRPSRMQMPVEDDSRGAFRGLRGGRGLTMPLDLPDFKCRCPGGGVGGWQSGALSLSLARPPGICPPPHPPGVHSAIAELIQQPPSHNTIKKMPIPGGTARCPRVAARSRCQLWGNKSRLSVFAEGNTLGLIRAVNQPLRVRKQAVCRSCHLNNNRGGLVGDERGSFA